MNRKFWATLLLLALPLAAARAWDEGTHRLIDTLAARQLRPEAVQKIEALLPLLDTRFHNGRPYDIVTAGCWLDDMRGLGKANPWARWHYIDIPCTGGRAVSLPPPPHALSALDEATGILRNRDADPGARAEALAQIMHIVADIHQPLHTATRGDRGGNDVRIAPLLENGAAPSNLHAFWDAACRFDAADGRIAEVWPHPLRNPPDALVAQIRGLLKNTEPIAAAAHPWRAWACETHRIACESGWPPIKQPGHTQLTPEFVHAAHGIACKQVARAAWRLAGLLNDLLAGDDPKTDRSPSAPAQSALPAP